MAEEYYEKKDMERDLGVEVEVYTPEEIDAMYEQMKAEEAVRAYIRKIRIPWRFDWER